MNLSNPKIAMFFAAYLPQSVSPDRGAVSAKIAFLGIVFIVVTVLCFSLMSIVASVAGGRLFE